MLNRQILKECLGKIKHETLLSAERHLLQTINEGRTGEIYLCEHCQTFHIGSRGDKFKIAERITKKPKTLGKRMRMENKKAYTKKKNTRKR